MSGVGTVLCLLEVVWSTLRCGWDKYWPCTVLVGCGCPGWGGGGGKVGCQAVVLYYAVGWGRVGLGTMLAWGGGMSVLWVRCRAVLCCPCCAVMLEWNADEVWRSSV